jgi:hypothetical protein
MVAAGIIEVMGKGGRREAIRKGLEARLSRAGPFITT